MEGPHSQIQFVQTLQRFVLLVFLLLSPSLLLARESIEVVNPDSPEEMSAFIVQERGEFVVLPYSELLWLGSAVRSENGFELGGFMFSRLAGSKNTKPIACSFRDGSGKSVLRFEAEGRVFPFEDRYAGMIVKADRSGEDASGFVLFRNHFDPQTGEVPLDRTFQVFHDYVRVIEERLAKIAELYHATEREAKLWSAREVVLPDQLIYRFATLADAKNLQALVGGVVEGTSLRVPKSVFRKPAPTATLKLSSLQVVYPWRHGIALPAFYQGCPLFQIGYVTYTEHWFSPPRSEKLVPGLMPLDCLIQTTQRPVGEPTHQRSPGTD